MKTGLTKEEIDLRTKAIAEAFKKCAFTKQDLKGAAEAISKAFKNIGKKKDYPSDSP
jgi:hypothetical protein